MNPSRRVFMLSCVGVAAGFVMMTSAAGGATMEEPPSPVVEREAAAQFPELKQISQITAAESLLGTFYTEGYVVKQYQCPPCLKGFVCHPCLPDHVMISEEKRVLAAASDKSLLVMINKDDRFSLGRYYRLLVKATDVRSMPQEVNNIRLIHAEALPAPGMGVVAVNDSR